tara:strand:- start:2049 stop:2201 length:153 start_codon:yes stop_codon:yes gene_type:complete
MGSIPLAIVTLSKGVTRVEIGFLHTMVGLMEPKIMNYLKEILIPNKFSTT